MFAPWKKSYNQPRHHIKKQRQYFTNKGLYSQGYGFSCGHVWMWELDHKGWALKNWCFWTVVLEKTLKSPLDCKEIQPVNPKGNQSWIFIGRTDADFKELTHWKRPWCWERLKAGGEGDKRGQDGWMASWTQWTWVWASSGRWWRTGNPGVLQYIELQSRIQLSNWMTITTGLFGMSNYIGSTVKWVMISFRLYYMKVTNIDVAEII